MQSIPITIVTGFLGSGKTTLILNLIPQLSRDYRVALLKNEFGDVAIDSQLASSAAISGVQELLNGCICCNLVGQLGDALHTLRQEVSPDRIIIETSGSAFPATLVLEVNRLGAAFVLDGVVSVLDIENWQGYEDTSYTAKMQARYTDLIVLNKWEDAGERRLDVCLDRIGDLNLEVPTPWVKSDRGRVEKEVLLGLDRGMARSLGGNGDAAKDSEHGHHEHAQGGDHQSEVEVLSISLSCETASADSIALDKLEEFLEDAPKDEIYRIKGFVRTSRTPRDSGNSLTSVDGDSDTGGMFILNWAFGRWTFTPISQIDKQSIARLTVVTARDESTKWKTEIEKGVLVSPETKDASCKLEINRIS